jgi:hypothetical protein
MQIEELYRTAIVALRNRQWEQATKNLLAVVSTAPQHRDAARVLMQLERLRPVSYWRGAFMFAIERSAWDQAEAAAAKLNEIDPALNNANDVATRLQELTAIGWYLPQAPEGPPPPMPESTVDASPSPPSESDTGVWLEDLARRQEEQSLARPTLDDVITPRTLEIPLDRLVALDQAGEWHAPEPDQEEAAGEWQPPKDPLLEMAVLDEFDLSGEDTDEYVTPRALKAMEFSEAAGDLGTEGQRGPIYDTLSTPRALKTAAFLDRVASAKSVTTAHPPAPTVAPVPQEVQAPDPVTEQPPDSPSEPAPEAPDSPAGVAIPPVDEQPPPSDEEPVQPDLPPVTATIDSDSPSHAPQAEEAPVPIRRRGAQPRHLLTVTAIVALLIVMLALIARLARSSTSDYPASASPAGTPAESNLQMESEIPALVASLDAALSGDEDTSLTTTTVGYLRDQIEALTPVDSPLQEALLTWLDAGQQLQTTRQRLDATCARDDSDPDQCMALQAEYDLLDGRTHLARNVVCILVDCPDA